MGGWDGGGGGGGAHGIVSFIRSDNVTSGILEILISPCKFLDRDL